MTILDYVFRDIEIQEPFPTEAEIVRACQRAFDRLAEIMTVQHDDLRIQVTESPENKDIRLVELSYFDRGLGGTISNKAPVMIKEKGKRRPKASNSLADYSFYNEYSQQ